MQSSIKPIQVNGITYQPIKLSTPRVIKAKKPTESPEQIIDHAKLPNHPSRIAQSGALGPKIYEEIIKLPYATEVQYKVSDKLASAYMKDQKDRKIGTLGGLPKGKLDLDCLQDIVKRSKYETKVKIVVLAGAPGSAKSTTLREVAIRLGAFEASCSITVICPRAEQRKDWERLTNLHHTKDYLIKTFETPFYQPCAETVIIEECGQMPPGWFDALLKSSPHIKYVFILGDYEQNYHYVSNNSAMTFNELNCFEKIVESNKLNYKNESYRLSAPQCEIKETKCLSGKKTFLVKEVTKFSPDLPLLTTSGERTKRLADQGHREVYSYQSAQGKDFKHSDGSYQIYQMELTRDCLNMEERVFYTAVTRSPAGIYIKFEDEKTKRLLEQYASEVPSLDFLFKQLRVENSRHVYNIQKLKGAHQLRHLEYNRSWVAVQNKVEDLRAAVRSSPKDYPKAEYPNFQFDLCKQTQFHQFSVKEYQHLADALLHKHPVLAKGEKHPKPSFRQQEFGWAFY